MNNKKTVFMFLGLAIITAIAALYPPQKVTIFLIGDSTCADKPLNDNPERGWGQLFPSFLNDDINVENHAVNGRSTKSFINEGRWKVVCDRMKPGDYVFIQFGHNDSKQNDTTRYAEPHTTYKNNLIRFVNETRAKGAIPVLLTPVNRRKFDDKGKFEDTHGDYPVVVREVSKEMNVPLIDVHAKSMKLFSELGPDKTAGFFLFGVPSDTYKALPKGNGDNTHFTHDGAIEISKLVVEGIKELKLDLVKYLLPVPKFSNIARGKVVGLDYYYNHEIKKDKDGKDVQWHYVWEDKDNSGYFRLGNIIQNYSTTLYEVKNAPTLKELKDLSVYIIVDPDIPSENPTPNYIQDSTIAEIVKWVDQGGVLMLMLNDKGNCEFEHVNRLSEKFGIHFNEDSRNRVVGTQFDMGKFDKFPNHPIFEGLTKKIYLKEISTMTLKSSAQPVLTDSGYVVMASASYGKGFVFAVGDPWIYNEYIDNRKLPVDFENYKAAENLMKWILQKGAVVKTKLVQNN
jgi:lysophospholipase L1-like esterase